MLAKVILLLSIVLAGCVQRTTPSAPTAAASTNRPEAVAVLHFEECARLSLLILLVDGVSQEANSNLLEAYLANELTFAAERAGMTDRAIETTLQRSFDKAVNDFVDVAMEVRKGREPDVEMMVLQGIASCMAVGVDLAPLIRDKP